MANSRHLVDPELAGLLDAFPTINVTPDNLAALRESARTPLPFAFGAPAPDVSYLRQEIPGPDGAPNVELHVYRAIGTSTPLGCIFHIHGGGYIGGAAAALEKIHRQMAGALNCALISVDYRLAPETAFPGNIEDCYAGLAWVFEHSGQLGISAKRIGVMGESAGGGLAAGLALLLRDRGRYQLSFQHLIYPMLDDRTCIEPAHPFTGEFIWNSHNNHFGWSALLGTKPGSNEISQYAAAARAESLANLPPTFISTGALDLFLDEDIEYARRLARAGVPIELHVYPGAFHGFDLHPTAKIAEDARRTSLNALARFLRC